VLIGFLSHFQRCLRLAVAAIVLGLSGCSGDSLPLAPLVENTTGVSLFSIEIRSDSQSLAVGDTLQLSVMGKDDRDAPIDVTANWRSANNSIAQVDSSGTVTALQAGTVVITATTQSPPREATLQLNVLPPGSLPSSTLPVLSPNTPSLPAPAIPAGPPPPPGFALAIYPAIPRVAPGDKLRFLALQGPPGFETPTAAVWRSENPEIATIDEAGVATALKAGTVTITAYSLAYPALLQRATLAVIEPAPPTSISGIRIRPSRVVMNVGDSFWLQADVPTWSGGFDPLVRWESGDPSVVSVSETGQLTALSPGKTIVSATAAGYTRSSLSAFIPVEVRNVSTGRIRDTLF